MKLPFIRAGRVPEKLRNLPNIKAVQLNLRAGTVVETGVPVVTFDFGEGFELHFTNDQARAIARDLLILAGDQDNGTTAALDETAARRQADADQAAP